MFGLAFVIERAWRRRHLALHLGQVCRVDRKDVTWRRGVLLRSVDHTSRRLLVLEEERTAKNYFAAEPAAVASAALIGLPAIEDFVGQDLCQHPAPRRPI